MVSLLLAFIMLPLLFFALLHNSKVQTYLVGHITNYLSVELDTEIHVGGVHIRPLRSVVLLDVYMKDHQDQMLMEMEKMEIRLGKLSVRQRNLTINELHFKNALLNFYKDCDQYNFQFVLDYFSGTQLTEATTRGRWDVTCVAFKLTNGAFHHQDNNAESRVNGFDPARFYVNDLHLEANNILIEDSTLFFDLKNLCYSESSAFAVHHMSGYFAIGHAKTHIDRFVFRSDSSHLYLNLNAAYNFREQPGDLFSSFAYQLNVSPSKLNMADIGFFVPRLYGMADVISIEGSFQGEGDHVHASNARVGVGEHSHFHGSFQLKNLVSRSAISFNVDVEEMQTNVDDMAALQLPAFIEDAQLALPGFLNVPGNINFSGTVNGTPDRFSVSGNIQSIAGRLRAVVSMNKPANSEAYHYHASLQTNRLNVGLFFPPVHYLGRMNMRADIRGAGMDPKDLDLQIDGTISAIDAFGVRYENIEVSGKFQNNQLEGNVVVDDQSLALTFDGKADFNEAKMPEFAFQMDIDKANLSAMKLFQRDTLHDPVLSASIEFNARGSSLDSLDGRIAVRDIRYKEYAAADSMQNEPLYSYATDSVYIRNTIWSEKNRHMRLRSDFLDADLHGMVCLSQLPNDLRNFADSFLPAFNLAQTKPGVRHRSTHQNIQFSFRFKNTSHITNWFFPGLELSDNSWVDGSFDSSLRLMTFNARGDMLTLYGNRLKEFDLAGAHTGNKYKFNLESSSMFLSDSIFVNNFSMETIWGENEMLLHTDWEGRQGNNNGGGKIEGVANFYSPQHADLTFLPSYARLNGDKWKISSDNIIVFYANRVEVYRLTLYNDDQFIMANGVLGNDPEEKMELSFANFDVAYTEILLGDRNFEFGGMMDGYVNFTGFSQSPSIGADIQVNDFSFNRISYGDLYLQSIWDNEAQAFQVDMEISGKTDQRATTPVRAVRASQPDACKLQAAQGPRAAAPVRAVRAAQPAPHQL